MKRFSSLIGLLFMAIGAIAQPITSAEYYFDNLDPGYGNAFPIAVPTPGTPISLVDAISTASLSPGVHYVNIRVKSDSSWSDTHRRMFRVRELPLIAKDTAQVIAGEYYFGNLDPGMGQGLPLQTLIADRELKLTESIDVSTLGPGFHQIAIRFKQENGGWSHTDTRFFYLSDSLNAVKLKRFEYEIRQGGIIVGTGSAPISPSQFNVALTFDANTAALSPGFYDFCVRVVDEGDRQSTSSCRVFQVQGSSVSIEPTRKDDLRVYPNPTQGPLQIDAAAESILQYQVSDLQGRIVRSQLLAPGTQRVELDLGSLTQGTYFLSVEQPGRVRIIPVVKQ